jgi:hypothetical protein
MRFDVETSQDYRSFDGVGIGAIFLDDNGYPCIKIPDVRSCYDFDIYNCIRLSDGKPSHFQCDEQVCIPITYSFKINI